MHQARGSAAQRGQPNSWTIGLISDSRRTSVGKKDFLDVRAGLLMQCFEASFFNIGAEVKELHNFLSAPAKITSNILNDHSSARSTSETPHCPAQNQSWRSFLPAPEVHAAQTGGAFCRTPE